MSKNQAFQCARPAGSAVARGATGMEGRSPPESNERNERQIRRRSVLVNEMSPSFSPRAQKVFNNNTKQQFTAMVRKAFK